MTPQVTTMPIAEALRGPGRIAGSETGLAPDVRSLSDSLEDLRRLAEAHRQRGSDSTAAYMLGRASQWPKAWLRRAMRERTGAYRMHSHHADGGGGMA